MNKSPAAISLVERKKYDEKKAHQIAKGIWWAGFFDNEINDSQNSYLVVDDKEAILINPGSCVEEHHKAIRNKVAALVDPEQIQHIVVLHHDPGRCAALPLFEKAADRNVRIYAPSRTTKSIRYYGCRHPIIGLDDGDSIILRSGRAIDYFNTPHLPFAGSGMLYDSSTNSLFMGNIFGRLGSEWNLYAPTGGWRTLLPFDQTEWVSKKAYLHALNKIERLSPERICTQSGPIIEEEIDKYVSASRDRELNE